MSLPRTLTEPTPPPGPTRTAPGEAPAPQPAGPRRVALALGPSPQQTRELEAQLRKRLRFSALLVVAFFAAEIGIYLPFALPRLRDAPWEAFTGLTAGPVGPGKTSRIKLGQALAGRYLQVIYVPDEDPSSIFVITAYELRGKAKKAYRRRQRRKPR